MLKKATRLKSVSSHVVKFRKQFFEGELGDCIEIISTVKETYSSRKQALFFQCIEKMKTQFDCPIGRQKWKFLADVGVMSRG